MPILQFPLVFFKMPFHDVFQTIHHLKGIFGLIHGFQRFAFHMDQEFPVILPALLPEGELSVHDIAGIPVQTGEPFIHVGFQTFGQVQISPDDPDLHRLAPPVV